MLNCVRISLLILQNLVCQKKKIFQMFTENLLYFQRRYQFSEKYLKKIFSSYIRGFAKWRYMFVFKLSLIQ